MTVPPMPNVIPLGNKEITDGMVLLLKGSAGDTLGERLFRASGGGSGTTEGSLSTQGGKIFGVSIDTGLDGHVYRNDVIGIYRSPLPSEGPKFYRKPYGYWKKRMPEIIRFVSNLDRKYNTLMNKLKYDKYGEHISSPEVRKAVYAAEKAMREEEKAIAKELWEGTKEIDTLRQAKVDAENKQIEMEAKRKGLDSYHIKGSMSWSFVINVYLGNLRQGRKRGPNGKFFDDAIVGLMDIAEKLALFNAQQERESNDNPPSRESLARKAKEVQGKIMRGEYLTSEDMAFLKAGGYTKGGSYKAMLEAIKRLQFSKMIEGYATGERRPVGCRHTNPPKECDTCGGRGYRMDEGRGEMCPTCGGSGFRRERKEPQYPYAFGVRVYKAPKKTQQVVGVVVISPTQTFGFEAFVVGPDRSVGMGEELEELVLTNMQGAHATVEAIDKMQNRLDNDEKFFNKVSDAILAQIDD